MQATATALGACRAQRQRQCRGARRPRCCSHPRIRAVHRQGAPARRDFRIGASPATPHPLHHSMAAPQLPRRSPCPPRTSNAHVHALLPGCLAWRQPRRPLASAGAALQRHQDSAQPRALVVYIPNFLHPEDFAEVQHECRRLRPKLRQEQNCIAKGRLGCYLPPSSPSAQILASKEVASALTQRLRSPWPLFSSDFPMELRSYPSGASMPWHTDEQLYATAQWELIYTVDNTSDSRTQWRDAAGQQWDEWTAPNSMLAVLAEGWLHRVTPVTKGTRTIIKLAYTSTRTKVPAFDANLTRVAFQ